MSYSSNQYNYATPLSSSKQLVLDIVPSDVKYFTLHDNALDGSYKVIAGDVGLWGAVLSDSNGNLATPYVLTVEETLQVNAIRLVGSQYSYPVAFTIQLYNGTTLLQTITETANNLATYIKPLEKTLTVTKYVVTITKISKAGEVVRLYNAYNPGYVKRVDTLRTKVTEAIRVSTEKRLYLSDTFKVLSTEVKRFNRTVHSKDNAVVQGVECATCSHPRIVNIIAASDSFKPKLTGESTRVQNIIDVAIDTLGVAVASEKSTTVNIIDVTRDTLRPKTVEAIPRITNTIDPTRDTLKILANPIHKITNIHTVMKDPMRSIYGKVYITYTDPMLDRETHYTSSGSAHNSRSDQVVDGIVAAEERCFTLYENNLSGDYPVGNEYSQVGWSSSALSDANGSFAEAVYFTVRFSERPIIGFSVVFDEERNIYAKDFDVTFVRLNKEPVVFTFTDNTDVTVLVTEDTISEVTSVTITIRSINQPNRPAIIMDVPVLSTMLYRGYKDVSDLISVDLLEELTYEDEIEALGGMSANEVTIVLDNSNRDFFFNNENSPVARQLKRNRKIVPWLGAEIVPGEIEWYTLGTFWSYNWSVPVDGLTATVVGFDTIGLLGSTQFIDHKVLFNKSIGELLEYVISDVQKSLDFIEYSVDSYLYNIVVPYAWFDNGSHADALRKIAGCYPMHIYCDRQGVIQCKPQKLNLDYYYDTWADNTNVISKTYQSLYTALPNLINITVVHPTIAEAQQLVMTDVPFTVNNSEVVSLSFTSPFIDNLEVNITCDSTVSYTYKVYSWGLDITFVGTGEVQYIECNGDCLDVTNTSVRTGKNQDSIRLEGAIVREVSSDFIQSSDHADLLISRLFGLSQYDKYDATVEYRGDISLTINDPILLQGGIAPDNRYNIKRHELSWNGALTGSAELNT